MTNIIHPEDFTWQESSFHRFSDFKWDAEAARLHANEEEKHLQLVRFAQAKFAFVDKGHLHLNERGRLGPGFMWPVLDLPERIKNMIDQGEVYPGESLKAVMRLSKVWERIQERHFKEVELAKHDRDDSKLERIRDKFNVLMKVCLAERASMGNLGINEFLEAYKQDHPDRVVPLLARG